MNIAPALAVEKLGHRFGPRRVLKDVSFSVAPGEAFGLVGCRAACSQTGADLVVDDPAEIRQQPLDIGSGDASNQVFAVFAFESPV